MNCYDIRQEIELYVLGDVSDAQRKAIAEHLSHCQHCRAREAEYLALTQKIRENTAPKHTRLPFVLGLRSAIQEEISHVSSHSSRRRLRLVVGITAACAVMGIVLTVILTGRYVNFAKQSHLSNAQNSESGRIVGKSPEFVADASEGSWRPVWQSVGARAVIASAADEIALGGGRVYVLLDEEGGTWIAAYDAATGQPQWRTQADYCGFLASDESRVYGVCAMSTGEFALTAWDGRTGNVLWNKIARNKSKRPWRPSQPIVLSENRVCWATCNRLHVFESSQGKKLWSTRFEKERFLSPAIRVGSRLYVAGQRNIYGVDPETGKVDWQLALGEHSGTWRQPLLTGEQDRVFVSQETRLGDSRLTCVNMETQEIAWEKTVSRISHLCAADDRLYLRSQHIQALDAETGLEVWKFSTAGCGPVTYAQRKIYFTDTSQQGCLLAVNGRSGEQVWQWPGVASCNAFLRIGNFGILKTNDGTVHAIHFQG